MERRGSRELGFAVGALVVVARPADGLALWAATAFTVAAVVAATLHLLGEWRFWRVADRLALPALAAFGGMGLTHLVGAWPWLLLAAPAAGALVAWAVSFELGEPERAAEMQEIAEEAADAPIAPAAPAATTAATTPAAGLAGEAEDRLDVAARVARAEDRALTARMATLGFAFLAFAAVGGIVPSGLAGSGERLTPAELVAVVLLDAAIGALAGLRTISLTGLRGRAALVPVNHYLAVAGHLGAIVRVAEVPRLLGPALLTVAVYIWTQYRESPTPVHRTPRLVRESALFALAAMGVVAWGIVQR